MKKCTKWIPLFNVSDQFSIEFGTKVESDVTVDHD